MPDDRVVVFVCEHGAAKSVLAATHFDKLASEMGLTLRAVARGTYPDPQLSPQVVRGLLKDGLAPKESFPRELSEDDVKTAFRIITFCELPSEYQQEAIVERWDGVPAASENYEQARNVIKKRIGTLLQSIKA